jgi:hypothetical protein
MIRETHPDDFDVADLPPPPRPSSGLVIVLPIALGLAALVLVAALHAALGAPLGVAWGQEVWSLVKAAVWPTIACASIGAYVRGQAMLAARALPPPLPPGSPTGRRLTTGGHRVLQISEGRHGHGHGGGREGRGREDDEP